mmetsp:Transcript_12/g.13  ORF Transcript_12/g.13 Transcript_12/m.13 type:complete len:818 (+) Transcript_12:117-2570(+)
MASRAASSRGVPDGSVSDEENIKVCVRFRPINSRERRATEHPRGGKRGKGAAEGSGAAQDSAAEVRPDKDGAKEPWAWDKHSVRALFPVTRGERSRLRALERYGDSNGASTAEPSDFHFDRVFGAEESTETLYDEVMQDLVVSAMEGKHCSAFAFGQTSTGKTYTMQGTSEYPGVIPRAIHDVFSYISKRSDREFLLRVSYLEVYNESVNDLFEPLSTNLKIFDDPRNGPQIQGLEEKIVVTPEQVFALISSGEAQRHIGSTDYNKQSSRSHTIFRLVIESKSKESSEAELKIDTETGASSKRPRHARVATLNLVDLAGSESSQSVQTRTRRQEGSHINKSLLTLTHIIYKLSERAQYGSRDSTIHIPYRDSKLTRILQKSLQGNSRISIVCTATPWIGAAEETLNTLRFATRAKRVRRAVHVNEMLDDRALLLKYKQEIATLRERLAEAERRANGPLSPGAVSVEDQQQDSGESASHVQLRSRLDDTIRNLNRVILNSTLPDIDTDSDDAEDSTSSRGTAATKGLEEIGLTLENGTLSEPSSPIPGRKRLVLDESTPFFRRLSSIDHDMEKFDHFEVGGSPRARTNSATLDLSTVASGEQVSPQTSRPRSMDDLSISTSLKSVSSPRSPKKSPNRSVSPGKRIKVSAVAELRSIREQLSTLLARSELGEEENRGSPEDSDRFERDAFSPKTQNLEKGQMLCQHEKEEEVLVGSEQPIREMLGIHEAHEYIELLETKVRDLEDQIHRQNMQTSVSQADRSFLENLLAEKDKTIREWSAAIEEIEAKQQVLEEENAHLKRLLEEHNIAFDHAPFHSES